MILPCEDEVDEEEEEELSWGVCSGLLIVVRDEEDDIDKFGRLKRAPPGSSAVVELPVVAQEAESGSGAWVVAVLCGCFL